MTLDEAREKDLDIHFFRDMTEACEFARRLTDSCGREAIPFADAILGFSVYCCAITPRKKWRADQ